MDHSYWLRQTSKPLFPELEWEKPERRDRRGKLAVIGGTKHGFASAASAYNEADEAGAGQDLEVFRRTVLLNDRNMV